MPLRALIKFSLSSCARLKQSETYTVNVWCILGHGGKEGKKELDQFKSRIKAFTIQIMTNNVVAISLK